MVKLAIIRVRGFVNVLKEIEYTMANLGLLKKNSCVIVEETKQLKGMLNKIKDYVTWGEVSAEALAILEAKRGKTSVKNEFKTIYFLAPPKGGYEKKGIKVSFVAGGAIGYRADKINKLIEKMTALN
jgi:large subunit ribosomal protein L30